MQPVPHVRSHVFFVSQLNVALFGGAVPVAPSAPPSPAPASPDAIALPPNAHLPPALQVQVVPVHVQSPEHKAEVSGMAAPESLPHPSVTPTPSARTLNVASSKDV